MIGYVKGTCLHVSDGVATIDVGGLGYDVAVGLKTSSGLLLGQEVTFFVHTHVREDQLTLYGFASVEGRLAFRTLLSVSSVGPKLALGIVDQLGAEGLAQAIARQERTAFKGITGVGKKTVERILLDLQGKLVPSGQPSAVATAPNASAPTGLDQVDSQVHSALVNMGYKPQEVALALQKCGDLGQGALENRLRNVLAQLA